jgi:hypothetical protein
VLPSCARPTYSSSWVAARQSVAKLRAVVDQLRVLDWSSAARSYIAVLSVACCCVLAGSGGHQSCNAAAAGGSRWHADAPGAACAATVAAQSMVSSQQPHVARLAAACRTGTLFVLQKIAVTLRQKAAAAPVPSCQACAALMLGFICN